MTDPGAAAQAERIRRLQQRRGRGASDATARRKHPAAASRILAVGVTIASFFGVVTALGIRQNSTSQSSTSSAVVPAAAATAAPTPVAAMPVPAASSAATVPAPTSATPVSQTVAPQTVAPQTTTRGS